MTQLLHPVADSFTLGNITVVGGQERHEVLRPIISDDRRVEVEAMPGVVFDQRMQAKGPIGVGGSVFRIRLARLAGDAGIQVAASIWRRPPREGPGGIIASINPIYVWHDDFRDRVVQVIGREADWVAGFMGDLWARVYIINVVDGTGLPTLGVSYLALETPDPFLGSFTSPNTALPAENVLVTVRTFQGRWYEAKQIGGEWYNSDDSPFEHDKHDLLLGPDGRLQASIQVEGWSS